MQITLPVCNQRLFLNPVGETFRHLQCIKIWSRPRLYPFFPLLSRGTHIPNHIMCARNRKRRSGSLKLWKKLPKLVIVVASNLKILPEPWDVVVQELGGGESWKGFKGKRKVWPLWVFLEFGLWGWLLLLFCGRELNNAVYLRVLALLCLSVAGVLGRGLKRGLRDWVLGVILVGGLMGLGLRGEDMQKWVERIRVSSPVLELVKGKRRKW